MLFPIEIPWYVSVGGYALVGLFFIFAVGFFRHRDGRDIDEQTEAETSVIIFCFWPIVVVFGLMLLVYIGVNYVLVGARNAGNWTRKKTDSSIKIQEETIDHKPGRISRV